MDILVGIISVFWILRIAGNVVTFSRLWWLKEYRLDRMRIHLSTRQGRRIYFGPWKKPPLRPRVLVIAAGTIISLVTLYTFLPFPWYVRLLVADVVSLPVSGLWVMLLVAPVALAHAWAIAVAVRRLRRHADLLVIGVTGSFGKTTTKEYLAAMLSAKLPTLKTPESRNSPIGIAEAVNASLTPGHRVFVAEMAAYKTGEIAYMSGMVRPQIGIVTAINAQHQDLFGSIENTMRAKFELIAGLTGRAIAILNADDPRVRTMGQWAKDRGVHIWWISANNDPLPEGERAFTAEGVTDTPAGIAFTVVAGGQRIPITAPVAGRHQVTNILAAVAAASAAGLSPEDIARGARRIRAVPHVLEIRSVRGIRLVDDTFNNNPDAARAAIDVLSASKGKKILVFQPMIELGGFAQDAHRDIGEYAARRCDEILLTNNNWYDSFLKGAKSAGGDPSVRVLHSKNAVSYLKTHVRRGDTVLFKGKEAYSVLTGFAASFPAAKEGRVSGV